MICFEGHAWGPESKERKDAMKDLDQIMGNLLDSIDERNMTDEVDFTLLLN